MAQLGVFSAGFGFMGVEFTALTVLSAPVVNILGWTTLVSLAAVGAALAPGASIHRSLAGALAVLAVAWFPVSLWIFGNARFSGTTDFLWTAWLTGTAALVLSILASLAASAIRRLLAPRNP